MKSKKVILFTLLFFSAFSFRAENPPYKNPELSPDERALDLLNRMTLKEKFAQMHNNSGGIERLGVRSFTWNCTCGKSNGFSASNRSGSDF